MFQEKVGYLFLFCGGLENETCVLDILKTMFAFCKIIVFHK